MNKIFEWATSAGKTKAALDASNNLEPGQWNLVVVPKLVLIKEWKKEIKKWGYDERNFDFVTYASLHKKVNTFYKNCLIDEAHHITDRVKDILNCMHVENWYFLSATLSRDMKFYLQMKFNAILDTKTLRDQIDIGRLPEPEVILIPLQLDNQLAMFSVKKKYNGKEYTKMFTQRGLIDDMQGLIDWYKNKVVNLGNSAMKFRWLSKCLERNKQLSMFKEEYTKRILDTLKNERTFTFCCDIKQSNRLGENSIDSKNKKAQEVLDDFNEKKINHITAINCVNEGCNLSDCEYCVFNFLSSSFLVSCQRVGRSLRHPNPKIIIPYFENTREEEQLEKMLIDIDAQNVKKTTLSMFEHKYGD
jgi:superfamily II DNA or RNA helicase